MESLVLQLPYTRMRRPRPCQRKVCTTQKVSSKNSVSYNCQYQKTKISGESEFSPKLFILSSALGCPLAKKRKLQEAEESQPAPKKKPNPLKLAMDDGFNADSDTNSETEAKDEEVESEEDTVDKEMEAKEKTPTSEVMTGG